MPTKPLGFRDGEAASSVDSFAKPSDPLLPVYVPRTSTGSEESDSDSGRRSQDSHRSDTQRGANGAIYRALRYARAFAIRAGAAACAGLLAQQHGASSVVIVLSGTAAAGAVHVSVYLWQSLRKRQQAQHATKEREAAKGISSLMAWNEALGAVRRIVETFSDGLDMPHTMRHVLLDSEILRRHHTSIYDEMLQSPGEPSSEDVLIGTYQQQLRSSTNAPHAFIAVSGSNS